MLFISCSSWLWPILPNTESIHRDNENFYMAAKNEDQRIWPSKLKEKQSNTSCKTCSGLEAVVASWLTRNSFAIPSLAGQTLVPRCQRAEQHCRALGALWWPRWRHESPEDRQGHVPRCHIRAVLLSALPHHRSCTSHPTAIMTQEKQVQNVL